MTIIPKYYLETLLRRDFLILTLVTIIGQMASAFLILALIVSVYSKTGSNFGVSGVILSFAAPGFLLMAFAGLAADLFDRKKIIVASNTIIALIVFFILASFGQIYASISLSFLYFAGNAFFIPAATAASAQLVRKPQLLASNSIFVFCLAGGQIFGFLVASVVHFFLGNFTTLVICEFLLVLAALLSLLLPEMPSREKGDISFFGTILKIWRAFSYIFGRKKTWFFFVVFALMQGIIAFGVTLGPGFFDEILAMPIEKSPILVFPMVGLGATLGAIFVHNPKIREGHFLSTGIGAIGIPGLILGLMMYFGVTTPRILIFPVSIYLVFLGFGVIVSMIASRTVLQKAISHNYHGSVFGANTILASFFAGTLSPFAAGAEALIGYVRLLIIAGIVFTLSSALLLYGGNKWKF